MSKRAITEDMSEEKEELIDPRSWTQKELVKHLYREILEIKLGQKELLEAVEKKQREGIGMVKVKQEDFENRIRSLETDLNKRKGFYAAAVAIIAFLSSLLQNILAK